MKTSREIDSTAAPFFGDDTDELVALRKLATTVAHWKDEKEDVSQETIFDVLKEVQRVQRKKIKRKH